MKEANNCYECPHRGEVAGSAHSSCNVLGFAGPSIVKLVSSGLIPALIDDNGEELVSFDPYGVKNNWCNWPQNFDPTWVTCRLPIEEKKYKTLICAECGKEELIWNCIDRWSKHKGAVYCSSCSKKNEEIW